jgi:hypothetical protein
MTPVNKFQKPSAYRSAILTPRTWTTTVKNALMLMIRQKRNSLSILSAVSKYGIQTAWSLSFYARKCFPSQTLKPTAQDSVM